MIKQADIRKKRLKIIMVFLLVLSPFILTATVINLLIFGNPQWHKIFYRAQQTGLWGLFPPRPPVMPENYTGVWIDYKKYDGRKIFEGEFKNGKKRGKHIYYNFWIQNGISQISHFDNHGRKHGIDKYWPWNDHPRIRRFEHGKLVYDITFASDKTILKMQIPPNKWEKYPELKNFKRKMTFKP